MTRPLDIICVGGGPGCLYFALLMKKSDPGHRVRVVERNRAGDTFGFGVVFSDATMAGIADADADAYRCIAEHLVHWDDIDVHYGGQVLRSTGHGFSGMSRHTLLRVLQEQAGAAASSCSSSRRWSRSRRSPGPTSSSAATAPTAPCDGWRRTGSRPSSTCGPIVSCGSVRRNRFPPSRSTSRRTLTGCGACTRISTSRDVRRSSWNAVTRPGGPPGSIARARATRSLFLEALFAEELEGHHLTTNRSIWRQFPTVRTTPWSAGRVVLIGDAAHTAHFSVGSGTRMAMEDAVALRAAMLEMKDTTQLDDAIPLALRAYEERRRPQVESLQRAAQASLEWFEDTERYMCQPPLQFAFTLLTRSLRITHEDLRARDPGFLARVDRWVAEEAARQVQQPFVEADVQAGPGTARIPPPMFTPFRLRDLVIPNRVVVSPMCQYVADEGNVGDWHLVHLGSRAIGGAGLVMAEMTDVCQDGRISPWCAGLYQPQHAASWKRIVEFVHRESPAKIGIQLGHAGRKGATRRLWEGDSEPLPEGGWPLISASPLPYFPDRSPVPREMTADDMRQVTAEFVRATELASDAGFDLLEIHMAHGYLLASFISPLTNTRTDEYGGSLENRMRFPLAVFDACRAAWPAHQPMSARISAVDWLPGGIDAEDATQIARLLKAHDCDVIDVSSGQTVPEQRPTYGRLFQTPFSDRIRHEVGVATMAVGNISSYMDVNTIIAAGRADLCLLARAHLFDPYWTRHAAWMLGWPLPWPDPYRPVERYMPRFEFRFTGEK